MSYTVVRSFYNGNAFYEEGQDASGLDKELLEKAIADGNVAEGTTEGASESQAPLVETPEPVVETPAVQETPEPQPEPKPKASSVEENIQKDLEIS